MKIKSNILYLLSLLGIVFLLIFIWFSKGLIIGTGESAVPFYTYTHNTYVTNHTWSPAIIGTPSSFTLAYFPYFTVVEFLINTLNSPVIVQALVFFIFISCSAISIYYLVLATIPKRNSLIAFSASFFYLFNAIIMVSVLNRLQYPLIFLYAAIPLGMWLYIQGLTLKKYIYVLYLNIALLFFATAFALLSATLIFWLLIGTYLIFYTLVNFKVDNKKIFFAYLYTFLCFFIWIVCNLWWLAQFAAILTGSSYITTTAYTASGNMNAFTILSNKLGNLSFVFRLMHREFYLDIQSVWGTIYSTFPMIIISFIIPVLAFLPLLIKNKPRIIYYFLGLSLALIFFTKGSSGPFGAVFAFLFTNIRVLEPFRNPFEKIGIALPFAYAPLIGYSLFRLGNYLKSKYSKINVLNPALYLSFIFISIILCFPFFNRWVFTSSFPPANNKEVGYYVKVPDYYKTANTWLNNQAGHYRTIALPLSGEGVNFNWEYGYGGVEFSNGLFLKPFISHSTTAQFLDEITNHLERLIYKNPAHFYKAMNILNAQYAMVRYDLDYEMRKLHRPSEIESILNTQSINLQKSQEFDKLKFYKISDSELNPLIFASNQAIYLSDENTNLFSDILPYANYTKNSLFIKQTTQSPTTDQYLNQILIQGHLLQNNRLEVSPENALLELPSVRTLPGASTYPLVSIKEQLEGFVARGEDKDFFNLNLSSKRLVETIKLIDLKSNPQIVNSNIDRYINLLKSVDKNLLFYNTLAKQIILRQFFVIDQIATDKTSNYPKIAELKNNIDEISRTNQIRTIFPSLEHTYRFKVTKPGNYEIILNTQELQTFYYIPNTLKYSIDGQINETPFEINQDKIIANIYFSPGEHEISFGMFQPKNLVQFPDDIQILDSEKNGKEYSYEINQFDSFSEYNISFDYQLREGILPVFNFVQDIDKQNGKTSTPLFYKSLPEREKYYSWQTYSKLISPQQSANSAEIIFDARSWGNCENYNKTILFVVSKCNDKNYRTIFLQKSVTELKNLQVEKVFNQVLAIRKTESNEKSQNDLPIISFTKINNATYRVDVSNAQKPYILAFQESFHPLWQAKVNGKVIDQSKHILVNDYANGWLMDIPGSYTVELKFKPEDSFEFGKNAAYVSITLILIGIAVLKIKKYE